MGAAIRPLTYVQVGEETVRGTGVAASRRLLINSATWRPMEELEPFEQQMHGTLARAAVSPILTRAGAELEIATDVDFEQVLLFLKSGVKGAVTPTTPGTGEGRLWTFTPSVTADPAPDTYTLEFEEGNSVDQAEQECTYGFTTELDIDAALGGIPQMRGLMVGRAPTASTKTGALALPTLTRGANARWAVYLDTTWAGLGGTAITGQVYGFSWKLRGHLRPAYYLDNRAALDFSAYEYGIRTVELTMQVVHDPAAAKFVQSEETAKSAGTKRFIRVQLNGAAFSAPDAALARFLRLDGCYFHLSDSMAERGRDQDGNLIVEAHLMSAYDSTGAADISLAVQNNLATFPA